MRNPTSCGTPSKGNRAGHDPLVLVLVAVAGGLLFFGLGGDSIRNNNEAFYAEGAREMVESGDWLTPHFNYEVRFQKPPLTYWVIAICYKLLGITEFATRLPSALLAALSLLVAYATGTAFFEKRVALLGSLVLGTTLGHVHTAQSATPGIIFTFFIWLSLLGFVKAYVGARPVTGWLAIAYGAAGLAVLTKGPGGIVLPALAGTLFLLTNRDLRALKRLGLWWGLALALVIPVVWYLAMYCRHGLDAIHTLLVEENFERYTSFATKRGPLWYFTVAPVTCFPWGLLVVPAGLSAALRRGSGGQDLAGVRFCWAALIGWFLFFSAARDKAGHYIMALHLPVALVAAHMLVDLTDGRIGAILRRLSALLVIFSMLVLVGAVVFVLMELVPPEGWHMAFWAAPAAAGGLIWIGLRRPCSEAPKLLLMPACLMLAFEVFLGSYVWPHIEAARPCKAIGREIETAGPTRVVTYRLWKRSIPFYARRRVNVLKDPDEVRELLQDPTESICVIMDEDDRDAIGLGSMPGVRVLGRWRHLRRTDPREYPVLHALRPGQEPHYVIAVSNG